jgi:Lipase (class 3)
LSWFTRIIPIDNEYESARAAFEKVATVATSKARNRPIRFIVTGHSLGGGLAQHVAYAFPCVSAAVFDTSCVTDEFKIKKIHSPDIVSIHQLHDGLTGMCRFIGLSNEKGKFHRYAVDYISSDKFQHSIEGAVVGMARGVADCQREQRAGKRPCAVPQSDPRPKKLYCDTYGKYGPDKVICPELAYKK